MDFLEGLPQMSSEVSRSVHGLLIVLDVQENHRGVLVYTDQLNQTLSREEMWGMGRIEDKGKGNWIQEGMQYVLSVNVSGNTRACVRGLPLEAFLVRGPV